MVTYFIFLLRIFACFFQHVSGRSRVLFHQEQLHNAKAANTIVCMVRKSGTGLYKYGIWSECSILWEHADESTQHS